MTTPGNTVSRTGNWPFAIGEFTMSVTTSHEGEAPIDETSLDHIMEALTAAVKSEAHLLHRRSSGYKLEAGEVTHSSTRSMTMNGVTLAVEVALTVDRDVYAGTVAMIVDHVLTEMTPCMINALDPLCPVMAVTVFYL